MRLRTLLPLAASLACLSVSALPAAADEAAEAYLRSLVETIDASPDFSATFQTLGSDDVTDTTSLRGLAVASADPGFALMIDTIALTGFVPSDSALVAAVLRIDGVRVEASEYLEIEIANAEFRDFSVPTATGFVWDDSQPYVSLIKALLPLAAVEMSVGRISSVVLFQTVDGVESRVGYEQVNIDSWFDGRIAAISAGPITSESPDEDQLIAMSIASSQSRDVDLNAFFHVFDPDNYVDGVGDLVWHTTIGSTIYRDMIVASPGVTFTLNEISVRDVKFRQPEGGIAILAELHPDGPDMSEDPEQVGRILELLTSYGFGSVALSGIEVTAPGIDVLRLAHLSISDYSSDRMGEFALDRLAVAVEDFGAVELRRFAFGDLVPPSIEAFIAAMQAEEAGTEVDVASVIPKLGFIEIAGLDVDVADQPPASLERFRLDLRDYVGPIPTTVAIDVVESNVDAAMIDDIDTRQLLAALGYDRVTFDSSIRARWTSAGDMIFDSFNFAMKDVGAVSGDVTFTGILPTEYMALGDEAALAMLSFVRGSITAKDDSIVGRGLAMQATELGVDPEDFRQQFAMGLPFMLAFLGDPQLQSELAPILQRFIQTAGGSITMVAEPSAPVPVLELVVMGSVAPFELVKALSLTFSGIPGLPEAAAAPVESDEPSDDAAGGTQFDPDWPGETDDTGGGAQLDPAPIEVAPAPDGSSGSGTQFDPDPADDAPLNGGGTQFD